MFKKLIESLQRYRKRRAAEHLLIVLHQRYQRLLCKPNGRDPHIDSVLEELKNYYRCDKLRPSCDCIVEKAKLLLSTKLKKEPRDMVVDFANTAFIALSILVFFRQMVFEHQMIPTGSMRPTFREMDHVIVSKTAYGINNPFSPVPLAFDASLLKRGQIVTLTSENLPMAGKDIMYFGLLPGQKRFVKRLMAKMSDRVWFYGGKVWALDPKTKELHSSADYVGNVEYIPFHYFFGELDVNGNELISMHFRKKTGSYRKGTWNRWSADLTQGKRVLPWGMQDYAMGRLLTKQELYYSSAPSKGLMNADFYLEISHHPTIFPTSLSSRDSASPFYLHRSLLPLQEEQIQRIQSSMYTSRFVVRNQQAHYYSYEAHLPTVTIALPGVEDGIFEFEAGKAYRVGDDGQRYLLPSTHRLYSRDLLSTLYNCGVNWNPRMLAQPSSAPWLPFRYVYYEDGNLKTMGQVLAKAEEAILRDFISREEATHQLLDLYPPFVDPGRPSPQMVEQEGLALNDKEILLLGDNHSGSADSRDFGLVPFTNIQGSPSYRVWPPSSIMEGIHSPSRSWNKYDCIVILTLAAIYSFWRLQRRYRLNKIISS